MKWENNVRRVTPYIPGEQPDRSSIIKLNTNECPYPPAPEVAERAVRMNCDRFRLYPDTASKKLAKELCSYYGITEEQLFIGVGSDDVLAMSFLTFFNSGKPILFPDITYSFYEVWADLFGIPYVKRQLDDDFNIRKEDYMTDNGGIIIPNPNAPTGIFEEVDSLEAIIRANPGSIVIVDEAYVDFGGTSCLPLIEKYDNLMVVQTFSKSRAMAGIRIGYAMANPKLIAYLSDVKFSFNSYTMNMPAIELGAEAVKADGYFRDTVNKIVRTRERVKAELRALNFSFPDSKGNFIFAAHAEMSAKHIFEELKEKNIYVRYFDKPRISNYLRITIGTEEEMNSLISSLKDILYP